MKAQASAGLNCENILLPGTTEMKSILKKYLFLILLIIFPLGSFGQVIRGIVLDQVTKDTISFATIYFDGTSVGTNADLHGHFELNISNNTSMPLTISAIGYYSLTLASFTSSRPLIVYLTPKVYELKEIVVQARLDPGERKTDLRIFRDEFLGTTTNAMKCTILNENDIRFNYGASRDTLKAFASKPIIIDNRELGYQISYFLDKFEYYNKTKNFLFKGNMVFNEYYANASRRALFERKRKQTYVGSRMHFFRVLWENSIASSGFSVQNSLKQNIDISQDVQQDIQGRKFLNCAEKLTIYYYNRASYIVFLKNHVLFDRNGYFDPACISWEGDMAKKRVADMLPFDYSDN